MTVLISAPFADVRGDTLRWALGLAPLPTLAARTVALPDGRSVHLGVLGASHQILVHGPEGDLRLSETVACDLPDALPLPSTTEHAGYSFAARVAQLDPSALSDRVRGLHERLGADPWAIVATFPGAPDAITALALEQDADGSLAWQTWHAYPQTGELVHTTTTLPMTEETTHGP